MQKYEIMDRKDILDNILLFHKAQPTGNGYIDIIVKRENYKLFIQEVISSGFTITAISWWEYCDSLEKKNKYGLGGPISKYYNGWFPEICGELDYTKNTSDPKSAIDEIINIVENKELFFYEYKGLLKKKVSFKNYLLLTPAFWIDVPDDWKNIL